MGTKLASPFSTGGGGYRFETHIQASFVTLMLTGGCAPTLPCWPVVEIKLQAKSHGFETDDFVVVVEHPATSQRRKLLCQVKHSISFVESDPEVEAVLQAVWTDFNNKLIFSRRVDNIALIVGHLNGVDHKALSFLTESARANPLSEDFFLQLETARVSPNEAKERLSFIRKKLASANDGEELSNEQIHSFLRHFHVLEYDMSAESGVVLSLLQSHIAQFRTTNVEELWARVVQHVQTRNQAGGTVTRDDLPIDLMEAFEHRIEKTLPDRFIENSDTVRKDWREHPNGHLLAIAALLGSWDETNPDDREQVAKALGIGFDAWLEVARNLLREQAGSLTVKNGRWKVEDRGNLWQAVGSQLLDADLDRVSGVALTILLENDPALDTPKEERHMASIQGKVTRYSSTFRHGIADGLAILGCYPGSCTNCTRWRAEGVAETVVREVLTDGDWIRWGSLDDLLPALSEAAPAVFLDVLEDTLRSSSQVFEELFSQERGGLFGTIHVTGLLRALEGLAWNDEYFSRSCLILGELARIDPGGQWANRPSSSLSEILLPWMPQTFAPLQKRIATVRALLGEFPDVGWKLILSLLPGQLRMSSGSHKPRWREVVSEKSEIRVSQAEYVEEVTGYSELALEFAGDDPERLAELIDIADHLPSGTFDGLVSRLESWAEGTDPARYKYLVWDRVRNMATKHRRHSTAKWALPEEYVIRLERLSDRLAPRDVFFRHQHLFTYRHHDEHLEGDDYKKHQEVLQTRQDTAIREILDSHGIDGALRFSEMVEVPGMVGFALGSIPDQVLEAALLPTVITSETRSHRTVVEYYVARRFKTEGWTWCDRLDRSTWSEEQIGEFLTYFPFENETWRRATNWLGIADGEYWTRAKALFVSDGSDVTFAVEKLLSAGRVNAAISCLFYQKHSGKALDAKLVVTTLLAASSSNESFHSMDDYHIVELIKFLQSQPSVATDDLYKIEWAFLPFLDHDRQAVPKTLEQRLAADPSFFWEAITLLYRPRKTDDTTTEATEGAVEVARNVWRLLHEWRTVPGTLPDGSFDPTKFDAWLGELRELAFESGHIEVASIRVGEVLYHAPTDPEGLWIHRAVASALNRSDAEDMRRGYSTATFNARGVHAVDPTGRPERELAEQNREKANELDLAGFPRFATTLREIAKDYDRDADRILDEFGAFDE
jgi:hypothetical protein